MERDNKGKKVIIIVGSVLSLIVCGLLWSFILVILAYNMLPVAFHILKDNEVSDMDTYLVGDARLDEIGFVDHHISSMNDFYENGVRQIITKIFKAEQDLTMVHDEKNIERINVKVDFTDVKIDKPTFATPKLGREEILTPNQALVNMKTYSASLYIDAKITATAYMKNGTTQTREQEIKHKKTWCYNANNQLYSIGINTTHVAMLGVIAISHSYFQSPSTQEFH